MSKVIPPLSTRDAVIHFLPYIQKAAQSIVERYPKYHIDADDLVQETCADLLKAGIKGRSLNEQKKIVYVSVKNRFFTLKKYTAAQKRNHPTSSLRSARKVPFFNSGIERVDARGSILHVLSHASPANRNTILRLIASGGDSAVLTELNRKEALSTDDAVSSRVSYARMKLAEEASRILHEPLPPRKKARVKSRSNARPRPRL